MNDPWTNTTGSFFAAYTSAQNGFTYAIDSFGFIHSYDAVNLSWLPLNGPSSNPIVAISAGSDGSCGVVDNTGDTYLYIYNIGSWSNLYITSQNSIAVGDEQNYVTSDLYGTVIEHSYSSSSYHFGPIKLSATAGLGNVMGVNAAGIIYEKLSNGYFPASIPAKPLKQIDVSLSPSSSSSGIYICGVDSAGDAWTLVGNDWKKIAKPEILDLEDKFVSLEVGNGEIWATFSNGQVFCRDV